MKRPTIPLALVLSLDSAGLGVTTPALAHEDRCGAVAASVREAGFDDRVSVTCTDRHAIVASDTYPPHEKMTGITGTNEQLPSMIERMANADANPIIGWAFDGFPIYGDANPDGSAIAAGELDLCNGRPDDTFGHRYHSSSEAPYVVQCLVGVVPDFDELPRVRPLSPADGGRGPEPGRPPRGGVENLVFAEDDAGRRTMTYRHEGADYSMSYAPSETGGCYDVETRTVTNDGELFERTLCR